MRIRHLVWLQSELGDSRFARVDAPSIRDGLRRCYGIGVNVTRRVVFSFLALTLITATVEGAPIADVRTMYLVPSDRTYNLQYEIGIINAFRDLQDWYADELAGPTFVLHDPIVEVFNTIHLASYYAMTPSSLLGSNDPFTLWFWANTVTDAFR
jgi:hypothetical protein